MPYRCYGLLEERIDFNTPHPTTGRPRNVRDGSPPGQLLNAQEAVLSGWCRISPTYRDLPADASPAIRSKAREVFSRLCYRHQLEVHDVEGGRFAFRVESLYDDSQPQDRWYYGIGVYQRTDPRAEDPFSLAMWDSIPGAPYETIPQGVARAELAAYARSKGIPCVTQATGVAVEPPTKGSALPSSYPSWVIALGLAAVGASVYFLTRQKPSTFKSNPAKRNGFKVRTGDLVPMGRLGDIDEQQGDKVAVRATSGWDHEVRKFASRTSMKDFLKKDARKSDHGAHGKRDWQALVKDVVAANNVAYPSFQKEDRR